jgi:hypothetical protein
MDSSYDPQKIDVLLGSRIFNADEGSSDVLFLIRQWLW